MSIPVALDELRNEIARHSHGGFLITTSADGRPHVVAIDPQWDGDTIVSTCGRKTADNTKTFPGAALLWPPTEAGGYNLIVDVTVTPSLDGDQHRVRLAPTKAVLHRPAIDTNAGTIAACGSDCAPLPS
jgi:hypothetical protein